jgi:hypothetical protein
MYVLVEKYITIENIYILASGSSRRRQIVFAWNFRALISVGQNEL